MTSIRLGKIFFDTLTMDELIHELILSIDENILQTVITPNLDMWFKIQRENRYDSLIKSFTITIPDGMPIARSLTKLSGVKQERVTGSDLLPNLLEKLKNSGKHVCFLGGPAGVAEKCAFIASDNGLVGTFLDAPMNLLNDAPLREGLVMESLKIDFDVLVLGFGFPLQEILCKEISERKGTGIYLNVGMALPYLCGEKVRAPKLLQKLGLEWIFRLISEPVRLFRRYVIIGPQAFFFLKREIWKSK